MIKNNVPIALKRWFVIHFIIDILFAFPLFFFPVEFLKLLGWQAIDPVTTRIVAAALIGIGIESYLGRNALPETYKNMLNLKIIWSGTVIIGIVLSIIENSQLVNIVVIALLVTFLAFHLLWWYWRIRIGRILAGD